ncbi:hypothetical protein ZWY2020_055734 [Hordeum vulgare]|nr:hypothetical protein ZWY2020_055734 [Hordeum vulgare]
MDTDPLHPRQARPTVLEHASQLRRRPPPSSWAPPPAAAPPLPSAQGTTTAASRSATRTRSATTTTRRAPPPLPPTRRPQPTTPSLCNLIGRTNLHAPCAPPCASAAVLAASEADHHNPPRRQRRSSSLRLPLLARLPRPRRHLLCRLPANFTSSRATHPIVTPSTYASWRCTISYGTSPASPTVKLFAISFVLIAGFVDIRSRHGVLCARPRAPPHHRNQEPRSRKHSTTSSLTSRRAECASA